MKNPAHLFHASEEHDLAVFHPRPPPSPDSGVTVPSVYAIDHAHLANYLAPRDCPRVIFGRGPNTTEADAARFIGDSLASRIVTIERVWLQRARTTRLCLYAFERGPHWRLIDANAGVWISEDTVRPVLRHDIADPVAALLAHGAELRLVDNLWPLIDAVTASSLSFSIIRKRNAGQRR